MKKKIIKCLIVFLTFIVGLNSAFSASLFAATNNDVNAIPEDTNTISGDFIKNMRVPRNATVTNDEKFIRDISASTDISSLKAWINGSLIYENGKEPNFPDSIYVGMSFKVALDWKFKDSLTMPLSEGDYFTINLGSVTNLNFDAEKKEILYIDRIAVGTSYFRYVDSKLTYTVSFNSNIAYFQNIKGNFSASGVFKNINDGDKVHMEFGTNGKGDIIVVEKPETTDPNGNVGIGIPNIKPINKELLTIGKSTYFDDMNTGILGWRIVFTELLHKNQSDLSTVTNPEYENTIIEDILDENQIFIDEAESGYGAPFFLDIPLMLPNSQNAVAYTGSELDERVGQVNAKGNGNSDYIIKPKHFAKLNSETEVRATPLSWTVVEVDNRQKLVINVGKLGTTDKTKGITNDLVEARYPDRLPKPITDIDGIIDTELTKYENVADHKSSPYYSIQTKFRTFFDLYPESTTELAAYETSFSNYMIDESSEASVPTENPPAIPEALKLPSVITTNAYKEFDKAITDYKEMMSKYVDKMTPGNPYKENLDGIIFGLKNAKTYYQKQTNRIYGFCLKYKTQITNGSTGKVSNEAKITTGAIGFDTDSEITHTYNSGISGVFAKGDIVFMKADESYHYDDSILATGSNLQGMNDVKFEVYDGDTDKKLYFFNPSLNENGAYQYYGQIDAGSDFTSIVETDEKGKFVLSDLAPNKNYYLKEVSKVDGYYENQNQKVSFTVDTKKVNYKLIENVSRSVTLKKIDKNAEVNGTASALQGAVFSLYTENDVELDCFKKEVIDGTTYFTNTNEASNNDLLTTQADGTLNIRNLPAGKYYLKEKIAPAGYILSDEKHPFTLEKDYSKTIGILDLGKIYNLKKEASLTIRKIDENTSKPLEDVAFELYKNESGSVWTSGIHNTWSKIDSTKFNQGTSYITPNKLLEDSLYTNASGEIVLSSIPDGDYYLKEVKALNGYEVSRKHYHFTINNTTQEADLYVSSNEEETTMDQLTNNQITNKLGTGSIEIIKYDRFQGASLKVNGIAQNINQVFYDGSETQVTVKKPLKGVIFDLYKQVGDSVNINTDTKIKAGLTTDKDGKIKVNDLEVGTYYFIEVKALDNYQLKQEPIIFEVAHQDVQEDSKTLVRLVDNYQFEYKVILNKQDKLTGIKLEGAHFELYDSANKVMKFKYNEDKKVYEYDENGTSLLITNQDGQIIIDGLTPQQKYFFKEVKAPEGYKIDSQNNLYEVEIKQADESIVVSEPIITEITCTNEKITTPDISQDEQPGDQPNQQPDNSQSTENSNKPTTSDITSFSFGTLFLSGCIAIIAYKRKKKHI
ncbi:MAG: SpaA isopeptide-forming pilin-related protein [Coprobacillus sp.]